jgi:hypothetical protein
MYNINKIKNKRIGRSLEFFANAKNRDDRFCLTPAAASLQRHSEPQAKNPEKIILDNWILRFAPAPLRMTMSVLSLLLSLNISTAHAVTCTFSADGKSVTITGSGSETFSNCASNSTNYPGDSWKNSIKNVTFGEGITEVGAGAFYQSTSIESVNMPSVTTIGRGAFGYAPSLTSVSMPNVITIDYGAFASSTALENVDMPKVETIGQAAFHSTSALTSVNIPNVKSIGYIAFHGSSALTNVSMPSTTEVVNPAFNMSLNDVNCLGTTEECAALKSIMKSNIPYFYDSKFYTVETPTTNCGSYSQGACNTCRKGFDLSQNGCTCHNGGTPIGGTCFPRRYTPAEAAELVGEKNTIYLYYK